jgi:hypothetical protein
MGNHGTQGNNVGPGDNLVGTILAISPPRSVVGPPPTRGACIYPQIFLFCSLIFCVCSKTPCAHTVPYHPGSGCAQIAPPAPARGVAGRCGRSVSRVLSRNRANRSRRRPFIWIRRRRRIRATHPDRGAERPVSGPFSVLLPAGLAAPPPSPGARWALTPPFHPYPSDPKALGRSVLCGAFPRVRPMVSHGPPRPGVTRRRFSVEPGLSSAHPSPDAPRPPDRPRLSS